ncbi:MAG: radical SAM protein [Endomicrobiia bacterium]|nr:radical SAM protein [Endomicrobiaceae bacterium]
MRISLVKCPVWGTREPPLALAQLSGDLKAVGIEVKSFDLNNYLYKYRDMSFTNLWAWEQVSFWYQKKEVFNFFDSILPKLESYIDRILENDPKIVGFSLESSSFYSTVYISDLIKKRNQNIKIFFGGQLFYDKRNIERSFNESKVDYILLGEGDVTVCELVKILYRDGNINSCDGICYKDNDKIVFTKPRQMLKNLDNLPFMDFSDMSLNDYDDNEHLPLMTSRGCVWACKFCSTHSFWQGYRQMCAERIHQEIAYHKIAYPMAGHIDFQDLEFNADVNRLKEFCQLMIKYPPFGSKQYWLSNAIVNPLMTKDILELVKESGCKKLIFGIESGSQRVLDSMGKKYKVKDAKKIIRDAYEVGVKVTTNFMFGFPGETEEDFQETLSFIKDVGKYIERVYPSRTYFAMEEFSYVYDHPEEFNIKTPFNHHLYWQTKDGLNTYPVRLKRCQKFEEVCKDNGVNVDCGVKTAVLMDEYFNLGFYYDHERQYNKALDCFSKYLELDSQNEIIKKRYDEIKKMDTSNAR